MKTADQVWLECEDIFKLLKSCVQENGWKARYLGKCSKLSSSLNKKEENTILKPEGSGIIISSANINITKMIKNIVKIEDSFEKFEKYPSVTERYYQQMYFLHNQGPSWEHHCVLVHSNKICLITLAPTHPIIKERKKIVKLDFQVSNKVDRLENKVSGKGKKGGQHIMPDSVLCYVECDDKSKYSIWGCIKGKLVEINQLLLKNPNLMMERPLTEGFIAIILPSIKDIDIYKKKLMTLDEYEQKMVHMGLE